MTEENDRIVRLGVDLLNKIISVTSFRRGGKGTLGFRPLAHWFFSEMGVPEGDFVLVLKWVQENHPDYYAKIDIPKKWDGGAHLDFPELFLEGDAVSLRALDDVPILISESGDYGPFEKGSIFTLPVDLAATAIRRRLAERYER